MGLSVNSVSRHEKLNKKAALRQNERNSKCVADRWLSHGQRAGWEGLSISLPVCSPQFTPVIALRTLHTSHPSITLPHAAVWPHFAPRSKTSHTCSLGGSSGGSPETKQHVCVYECLHAHTLGAEPHVFVRDWDFDSSCTQRITQGDPGFAGF